MKRSDFLIKLISVLVFAALLCYIGVYFIEARKKEFTTVIASTYSVEDGAKVSGVFVKEESLLYGKGGYVDVTAKEGDRLSVGDAYAIEYSDSAAMERASEIRNTQLEIEQVEALIGSAMSKDRTDNSVLELSYALNTGAYGKLDEASVGVRTYILGENAQYGQEELQERLAQLRSQLSSLEAAATSDTKPVTTDVAGTFSSAVDGFEDLSPDKIAGMDPEKIKSLMTEPEAEKKDALGKLVTDVTWYYVAVMDSDDAGKFKTGEDEVLSFSSVFEEPVKLRLESIGGDKNGERTAVFSCSRYFYKVASARQAEATVVLDSYSGIRVPRNAVYQNEEGEDVVYIIAGLQANEKKVEIVKELDGYYIVDAGKGSELRVGDEIILTDKEIHDGKIIL